MNDIRTPELPEISEESIRRIEQELFSQIALEDAGAESAPPVRATRSKRRTWLTVGGVAAAFAAGILVTPPLLNAVSPTAMSDAGLMPASGGGVADAGNAPDMAPVSPEQPESISPEDGADLAAGVSDATTGRDIIANARASVHVREIAAASEAIAALATQYGGYVESTNIGERNSYSTDVAMPVPPGGDYGWVTIRVPATALSDAMTALKDVGEVRESSISRHDVTSQAIDLRARVEATRASVERLTELMSQTGTVSELIEAEMALSERQAQLESYEQQLKGLEDQVAMSALSIDLVRIAPVTQADPAGFTDGFMAGWNGLIVSLNALVIAAGFVIPWLAVIGVAFLIFWLIRRSRRQRRAAATAAPSAEPANQ